MKKTFIILLGLVCTVILGLISIYLWVTFSVKAQNTFNYRELPETKVALLLGTSRYLSGGRENLYFQYRMDAALRLIEEGTVQYLIVSGDNSQKSYNEPRAMRQALIERGVPADRIIMDFVGFRTLDSVIRAHKVFGQDSFIVISQKFHNERALYIARHAGLKVFAYNARNVDTQSGWPTRIREIFARAKMLLDIYILHTEPRFLGEEVIID